MKPIATLTFSGGDTIQIDADSTVVFVGPNNAGKSQALQDIKTLISTFSQSPLQVVTSLTLHSETPPEGFVDWLRNHAVPIPSGNDTILNRVGGSVYESQVDQLWNNGPPFHQLAPAICQLYSAASIQQFVVAGTLINPLTDAANHPMHFLFLDPALERDLSRLSEEAFGEPLVLNRFGVPQLPLHFGHAPAVPQTAPPYPRAFLSELAKLPLLQSQGDGIKSFMGLAIIVTTTPYPYLLLDEPEAFLHPPQARLLGSFLQRRKNPESQLLLATHDANLLRGLLEGGGSLTVLRLTRKGNKNYCVQLSSSEVRRLWSDPLLRTSNLFEGLFHRGVVLCEADSDARFYQVVLNEDVSDLPLKSDLLFSYVGGKHRLPMAVSALRALGVPVSVIVDFDILNDEQPLRSTVESLGATWTDVEQPWRRLKQAIDADSTMPLRSDIKDRIRAIVDSSGAARLTREEVQSVRDVLRGDTGWDRAKQSGLAGLRHGDVRRFADDLLKILMGVGVFVVPVGALEGWVPEVGNHGPAWVADVIARGSHKHRPALAEFVSLASAFALK